VSVKSLEERIRYDAAKDWQNKVKAAFTTLQHELQHRIPSNSVPNIVHDKTGERCSAHSVIAWLMQVYMADTAHAEEEAIEDFIKKADRVPRLEAHIDRLRAQLAAAGIEEV